MEHETLTSYLKCDVELEVSTRDDTTLNKRAADALRKAADLVESGHIEDGFCDLLDQTGKKIGEIYVDYSEGAPFGEDAPN